MTLPRLILCCTLVFGLSSTKAEELSRHDFSGPAMSTTFRLSCYAKDRATAENAADACFRRIAELNASFTDYDPTSELMRLCAPEARYPFAVSAPLFTLLQRSRSFAELTQGAFDPTCGHATQLWRRSRRQGKLPPADRLQQASAATDWRRITLHSESRSITLQPGTLLDLGGIAKGYAADECLRLLRSHGLTSAVVIAGGDTAIGDPPPGETGWPLTLRTDATHETVETLANCAVSTSGDLYQFIDINGQRYSHILTPKTGLGLTQPIACSVIAPDCTTSDALATAMCVLGRELGEKIAAKFTGVRVLFATPP